jgi:hypothetical protein
MPVHHLLRLQKSRAAEQAHDRNATCLATSTAVLSQDKIKVGLSGPTLRNRTST